MYQYIVRRILQLIPTIIGVTIIVFLVINAAPGNPMSGMVDPNLTEEEIDRQLEEMGLKDPIHQRYWSWITQVIQGDLGYSFRYHVPVESLIGSRIGPTFMLSFSALFVSILLAVPIGVLSATRQYSKVDNLFTVIAIGGVSIPVFFLGILLIKFLAFDFQIFPTGGYPNLSDENFFTAIPRVLHHLILPMIALAAAQTARFMRYTRSSMLEVIKQDYVRTARAKGLSEKIVIYKHALRNALIPVITLLGLTLPFLFSGAILTETVFVWPGMGRLLLDSVHDRDYPLLMGINLFFAFMVMLGNLLADVLYAVVDPRIKYN
ncbi:ABC transporter permease [Natranaerobius thermophilus]|uniref:Binding-protein-dependent transport systems inner membrane component n=1 Tax=Natranaerobius thermophilus (strain ATCC BAA-1301 / DSM 18059 / JW/NM-WN-LF) TaxID=457570 RepID=B2A2X7_NATTJ|nr:ABC transporter permease [Natranaerobius thermophilus]ACB86345.1 binding-protein-dependent transport systems inner membrane component [Natranaerobius thermophilus JW/NM-WN-LF]